MTNQPGERSADPGATDLGMLNGRAAARPPDTGTFQLEDSVDRALERIPRAGEAGLRLSRWLHKQVLGGGERARKVADLLHGTWMGHPLHPMLTDITIGAWSLGAFFDLSAQISGSERADWAADRLVELGSLAALPTALSGVADFSTIPEGSAKTAALHGAANVLAVGLNAASIVARRSGHRRRGRALSWAGFGATTISGFLGAMLVYSEKVGVSRAEAADALEDWRAVMDSAALAQDSPARVEVDGVGIMLYRDAQKIYAISSKCSHAAGNLDEGQVRDGCVTCPLHDSVFSLRDGSVIHGPATRPQPAYQTRVRDGRIELRLRGG